MNKLLVIILALSLSALFTACSLSVGKNPEPPSQEDYLTLTEEEYPRVDGSTAAIPLGEATASVLMGKDINECAEYAQFSGTHNAYTRLLNEETDLLIVYEAARETKDELDFKKMTLTPIGADALVFLVNASNPVNNLTVEQVRDIYSGKIVRWSEVGGSDEAIVPFQRNATAGSQALMLSLVMGETPMLNPPAEFQIGGMGGLITAVSDFDRGQHSIGYNVYFYVTEMMADPNIKILTINGVEPNTETIGSGEYPLANDFFAVLRADEPKDSSASLVAEWLQSAEGQALIAKLGYSVKSK